MKLMRVEPPTLHPDHVADLKKSHLSDEVIRAAKIESVRPQDIPRVLGQNPQEVKSIYKIPYPGTDFYRCKLFPPIVREGRVVKYLNPSAPPRLFIPPGVETILPDPSIPLAAIEGEKKNLRAVQEGLPSVGIGGCWNWMSSGTPIPDLDKIACVNRGITIYMDSDVWVKPQVLNACYALGKEFESRGAYVRVAVLTPKDGEKRGLDDYDELIVKDFSIQGIDYVLLRHRAFSKAAAWYRKWNPKREAKSGAGRPLFQRKDEPWPNPVDGGELLEALSGKITRHVKVPEKAEWAIALWLCQTYAIDAMTCLPILAVTSATKREGKTTLLELIAALCARPFPTINVSPAALYRSVEAWQPTILCDEADRQFKENVELRTLMNASHRRAGAYVIRIAKVNEELEPRAFNVFGAKAVGLIGRLPSTMEDRSIEVRMKRKGRGVKVERMVRSRLESECGPLRQQIVRWLADRQGALNEEDVTCPAELDDRASDNWRGLFGLAGLAGGEWPERAKQAALVLSEARGEEPEQGEELLADLRSIFGTADRLFTEYILSRLNEMTDRPWPTSLRGKPMDANLLGRKLRPFRIKPKDIRIGDKKAKGYLWAGAMQEAFDTYLPPLQAEAPETSEQNQGVAQDFEPRQGETCLGLENVATMQNERVVADVSGKKGGVTGVDAVLSYAERNHPEKLDTVMQAIAAFDGKEVSLEHYPDVEAEEKSFRTYWATLPDRQLARKTWPKELQWFCSQMNVAEEGYRALFHRLRDLMQEGGK